MEVAEPNTFHPLALPVRLSGVISIVMESTSQRCSAPFIAVGPVPINLQMQVDNKHQKNLG